MLNVSNGSVTVKKGHGNVLKNNSIIVTHFPHGRFERSFRQAIFKLILVIDDQGISPVISPR